ncbi:MAG: VCBS repeat-containing protein [Verrucomicrobiales bacterium]|nr:VCBS repeat-containing protein [Verrucomicrobiales bacterium]
MRAASVLQYALMAVWCVGGCPALLIRAGESPSEPTREPHPSVEVQPAGERGVGFTALPAAQTGVGFTNVLSPARELASQILTSGSGVAAGDFDGDGWCDLYFCGLDSSNRLYRNLGNWRFADVTETAGVTCAGMDCSGAAFADIDGDGDLELLVNSYGQGTVVFMNEGAGRFRRGGPALNPGKGGSSMALGDIDGDGDLDLYVANYRTRSIADEPGTRFTLTRVNGEPVVGMVNGLPVTHPEVTNRFRFMISRGPGGQGRFAYQENGEPDVLYRNEGGGQFRAIPFTAGLFRDADGRPLSEPFYDWGLTVAFRDLNGDRAPDLFICNDFDSPDRIWLNDGRGAFKALPELAIRQICYSSMSLDFADLNRDGLDEIFTVDMLSRDAERRLSQRNNMALSMPPPGAIDNRPQNSRNMLFLNRGDGAYAEIAQFSGLDASEWSWTPVFLDVDLDGYEDLLIPNGFERDNMNLDALAAYEAGKGGRRPTPEEHRELRKVFPRLATRNLAFRNRGDLTFEETGAAWGFAAAVISQGMCAADLDNDGDLDLAVNNMNDAAGLYRNDSTAPRVAVRLDGLAGNTRGIGARIILHDGTVPQQSQEMMAGGRYLSADDTMRVFAAGSPRGAMRIEVLWRSGRRSVVEDVRANRVYRVSEETALPVQPEPRPEPTPLFEDASALVNHRHQDALFDDFARQPLLPRRLSQLGPGVCWFDVDQDGRDDLFIGSGKGGTLAAFRNTGNGAFTRLSGLPWDQPVTRDQTTLLGRHDPAGRPSLLVGAASHEDGLAFGAAVRGYTPDQAAVADVLPASPSSVGPLAMADYDGDGDLDLFVGGRCVPGRYPEPADSQLWQWTGKVLQLDAAATARFGRLGLVTGAVWTDLDGDGDAELALACEWGPVRIFRNQAGKLTAWNPALRGGPATTLERLTGWWTGINAGDFDGDGRLDLVAGNWGRNTKFQGRRERPLRLAYGDFDEDGTLDVIEAAFDAGRGKYFPERRLDTMAKAMPFLDARFSNHAAYAAAGLDGLLASLSPAQGVEADWLESTVFLNRGDYFEVVPLPFEAQLAPVFATTVADFDGDGAEDVFLSQNFFAVEIETSRHDGGRGLLLCGDGRGGFRAVPGPESGIRVHGEQRGAAAADFDADGRVDLVVTQNAAATCLLRNATATPGLRVRLAGTPGNPQGIGAVIRRRAGSVLGPAREIHAGSGYWSQDSAVVVLGGPTPASGIEVRWPGGKTTTATVPPEAREVRLGFGGQVEVLQ